MKKYLVEVSEEYGTFEVCSYYEKEVSRTELPPNAKVLTREDVEKAIRNHDYVRWDENFVSVADVLDELFGKEEEEG